MTSDLTSLFVILNPIRVADLRHTMHLMTVETWERSSHFVTYNLHILLQRMHDFNLWPKTSYKIVMLSCHCLFKLQFSSLTFIFHQVIEALANKKGVSTDDLLIESGKVLIINSKKISSKVCKDKKLSPIGYLFHQEQSRAWKNTPCNGLTRNSRIEEIWLKFNQWKLYVTK